MEEGFEASKAKIWERKGFKRTVVAAAWTSRGAIMGEPRKTIHKKKNSAREKRET